jgi:Sec-independent protein translocase protein TatA
VGAELLLGIAVGFVVLGPKRMHTLLEHLGRAKTEFDKARRTIDSQLAAEFKVASVARTSETAES